MIGSIDAHVTPAISLRVVRLVLFGRHAYETFVGVAGELLAPPSGRSHD